MGEKDKRRMNQSPERVISQHKARITVSGDMPGQAFTYF